MDQNLPAIRSRIKTRRRALSSKQIASASEKICRLLWSNDAFRSRNRIAVYMSNFGEVDCSPILKTAFLRKKQIYLPVLSKNRLRFAPYENSTQLTLNHYKILEPVCQKGSLTDARFLDVVIAPLVAFDANLNRVGMGGGYYDRSLAFRKRRHRWKRPLVIGLAYSFQRADQIQAAPWDVPMDMVITEENIFQ